MVQGDGSSYEKDTADGAGRAYPLPPNAGPQWHGPPQLVQRGGVEGVYCRAAVELYSYTALYSAV